MKRILAIATAIMATVAGLTGCSSASSAPADTPAPPTDAVMAAAAQSLATSLNTAISDKGAADTQIAISMAVADVRGHAKVPAGGHEKSPRVASESPHLASVVPVGS